LSSENSIDCARILRSTVERVVGVLGSVAHDPPQRRHVLVGRQLRRDAQRRGDLEVIEPVLQRALAVSLIHRPPLGAVGLQQRRSRVAAQDRAELPTEVLRVMDRARQTEPARGRVAVSRVADEEDATDLERRGDHGLHRPARDLVDLHREVADAERGAGVGLDLRVGLAGSRPGS
jgi:hypothetical protein